MRMPRKRITLSQIVQIAFAILVVVFIAIYLSKIDWASLENLTLNWVWLVLATVLALVFRYWGAGIWLFLLERLGAFGIRYAWIELSYVYAKAWLGRYLLGAGTWILGKVYFASQHGISKAKLAVSGLLEGALQLIATLIVGIGLLLLDPRLGALGSGAAIVSIIALICGVIALIPIVFRFGVRTLYRIVRRRTIQTEDLPDGRTIVSGGLLYLVATLITGVSYFFIAQAVYADLRWSDLLYVVGASSVAAAVSLLAVFSPGGIGVREGVQVLFFSALMPVEAAVIVSVLMRVWSLAVDGLFFGLAAAVRGLARKPRANSSGGDPS
ncbi:MAG: flippase-like domain-containing protein [Cryobacterium sp.]|nr:flippase-like domain-containing protein [Cryobacterium sp.]